jgi:aminoglycoside 3-N-acetyltransferase
MRFPLEKNGELGAMERVKDPITIEALESDLTALGVRPGMTLLVHSSLRSLGWVCGGAVSVILALERLLTPAGTLVMPTHSADLSEPSFWRHPPVPSNWWQAIRNSMPAYDSELTPSRGMGVIPETFRRQPGVRRSPHPQVSFAAWGSNAGITANHPLAFGTGDDSPLAGVYDAGGWVLLLGVGHAGNTSLHLAEFRAPHDARRVIRQGAPVLIHSKRCWVEFDDLEGDSSDFEEIGSSFAKETGAVIEAKVGAARALLMPQRPLVDFATVWIGTNRKFGGASRSG